MPDAFDPYNEWLGIPPEEQPPNHYRLLGVDLFEGNAEKIAQAALARTETLRNYQLGSHSKSLQKILSEVARAKICLLDPEKKATYDTKIGQRIAPTEPPGPTTTDPNEIPHPQRPAEESAEPIRNLDAQPEAEQQTGALEEAGQDDPKFPDTLPDFDAESQTVQRTAGRKQKGAKPATGRVRDSAKRKGRTRARRGQAGREAEKPRSKKNSIRPAVKIGLAVGAGGLFVLIIVVLLIRGRDENNKTAKRARGRVTSIDMRENRKSRIEKDSPKLTDYDLSKLKFPDGTYRGFIGRHPWTHVYRIKDMIFEWPESFHDNGGRADEIANRGRVQGKGRFTAPNRMEVLWHFPNERPNSRKQIWTITPEAVFVEDWASFPPWGRTLMIIDTKAGSKITSVHGHEAGPQSRSGQELDGRAQIPADAVKWNGHFYKVIPLRGTHQAALNYCAENGGHLARIESKDEQEFIERLTSNSNDHYWVDGSDAAREGRWMFSDGTPMSYFNWYPGEPTGPQGVEDFLVVWNKNMWNDASAKSSYSFICEWEGDAP